MELAVWLSKLTIPLVGWWLLTGQLQKFAGQLQNRWQWNTDFKHDFFKSFLISFCHASPENHCNSLKLSDLSLRVRLLWLGLRSFSYAFVFIVLFGLWNFVPVSVILLLGLVIFLIAQWWQPARGVAIFILSLGIFNWGFEALLMQSTRLTADGASPDWVYWFGSNYLPGALLGLVFGALIRGLTRMSGIAWWTGLNLMLAGILSLGGAWGFFLGDFLMASIEDFRRHRETDFRLRLGLGLGFALLCLVLTAPIQFLAMSWMNGEYSVQLRSLQLGLMIFLFLTLESTLALGVFHFYFLKKQKAVLAQ